MDDDDDTKMGTLEYEDQNVLKRLKKKTEKYISSVEETIIEQYGKIPPEFDAQIEQLKVFYLAFLKCSEKLDDENPVVKFSNGTVGANTYLITAVRLSQQINALVKNFGLSPLDRSKLKQNRKKADKKDEVTEGDTGDFMDDF